MATSLLLTEIKEVPNPNPQPDEPATFRLVALSAVNGGLRVTINLDLGEVDIVSQGIGTQQNGLFVNSNIGNDGTQRRWATN